MEHPRKVTKRSRARTAPDYSELRDIWEIALPRTALEVWAWASYDDATTKGIFMLTRISLQEVMIRPLVSCSASCTAAPCSHAPYRHDVMRWKRMKEWSLSRCLSEGANRSYTWDRARPTALPCRLASVFAAVPPRGLTHGGVVSLTREAGAVASLGI